LLVCAAVREDAPLRGAAERAADGVEVGVGERGALQQVVECVAHAPLAPALPLLFVFFFVCVRASLRRERRRRAASLCRRSRARQSSPKERVIHALSRQEPSHQTRRAAFCMCVREGDTRVMRAANAVWARDALSVPPLT
jgi:hypothetical protein